MAASTIDKPRERKIKQDNNDQKSTTRKPGENRKKSKYISSQAELEAATNATRHRVWTRTVIILSVITLVYFYTKNQSRETKFALQRENLILRMHKIPCSSSYKAEIAQYPECVPQKCGRMVTDKLTEEKEVETLLALARSIINESGGSTGGASILDLHSGALSHGSEFLNIYNIPKLVEAIREDQLSIYNLVKGKIKKEIADKFGISPSSLYLTYPTFFSRITNATAKTVHDEYWHEHVDKETYPSFHYTSLLYLNSYKQDFKGGRFIFVDGEGENRTISSIEPKKGRISAFTSGEENRHHVEKVEEGERYAITISFTCDKKFAIADPKLKPPN